MKDNWKTMKNNFKYLSGTTHYGIFYQERHGEYKVLDTHGFYNVEWAQDLDQ